MLCTASAVGLLTGCSSSSVTQPAASTSSTAVVAPTAATTPSPAATTAAPTRTAPANRTEAVLRSALIPYSEGNPYWTAVPDVDAQSPAPAPTCAALVSVVGRVVPHALSSARVTFAGGRGEAYLTEQLATLGSAQEVDALMQRLQTSVDGCRTATIDVPGKKGVSMVVTSGAAKGGTAPVNGIVDVVFEPSASKKPADTYYWSATAYGDTLQILGIVGIDDFEVVDDAAQQADATTSQVLGVPRPTAG